MTTAATTNGHFIWHECFTPDPAASGVFLGNLFGWEVVEQQFGDFTYPILQAGGGGLGGMLKSETDKSYWIPNVTVADVDATLQKAVTAGGQVTTPALDVPSVGRVAVLTDPFGARLGIITPMPCEDQTGCPGMGPGRVGWTELACAEGVRGQVH